MIQRLIRFAGSTAPTVVNALAVIVLVGATVQVLLGRGQELTSQAWGVCFVFLVLMIAGELMRIGGMGSRGVSPVAMAAALGMALATELPEGSRLSYGAAVVICMTAAGMVTGVGLLRWIRGGRVSFSGYAIRLLMVAFVAVCFRALPLIDGRPLAAMGPEWRDARWRVALSMIAVLAAALILELLMHVSLRSLRRNLRWRAVLREDAFGVLPTELAVFASAVVVALGMRSLGVFAIPLFLLPLVLMRFAIRRQQHTIAARRQTVAALSQLTDLAGYTNPGHAGRVTRLCLAVGRDLNMTEAELANLETAALLHDIGQVSLTEPIPEGATVEAAPMDQQRIANDSAEIVRRTGVLDTPTVILEQQALPFRFVRERGEPQLLEARILKVCNAYDDLSHGDPARHEAAIERIMLGLGYEYDPRVVDSVIKNTEPSPRSARQKV